MTEERLVLQGRLVATSEATDGNGESVCVGADAHVDQVVPLKRDTVSEGN